MRHTTLPGLLGMIAVLGLASPSLAAPEELKGMRFIDVMSDNTLSGKTASGAEFNIYFLDGGAVNYDDSSGKREHGRWQMDPDGDVCIGWEGETAQHCFKAFVDGDRISWEGKGNSGEGILRGGVGESFLKPR